MRRLHKCVSKSIIETLLYRDVSEDKIKKARELLDETPYIVDLPDKDGVTPLQEAVSMRNVGMVKLLLKRGANINATTKEKEGQDGDTVLNLATWEGPISTVKLLLGRGANIK